MIPPPPPSPPKPPPEYQCGEEGDTCECEGEVKYGCARHWSEWRNVVEPVECSNDVFGDPMPHHEKVCKCRLPRPPAPPPPPPLPPDTVVVSRADVSVADAALLTAGRAGASSRMLLYAPNVVLPASGTSRPSATVLAGYDSLRIKSINDRDAAGCIGLRVLQSLHGVRNAARVDGLFEAYIAARIGTTPKFSLRPIVPNGTPTVVHQPVSRPAGCLSLKRRPKRKRGQSRLLPPQPCAADGNSWLLADTTGLAVEQVAA